MSMSNQANERLYFSDMHIELRHIGMCKTLNVYIFVMEHDIIPVSLNCQLLFDSLHLAFIQCRNGQKVEIGHS